MIYNHLEIERKVQKKWADCNLYTTDLNDTSREKYYLLTEFPYPSGDLHIGHWYAFAVTDIYARVLRLRGINVLFPIGFDAFGLPAENAAIKNKADPKKWTHENIARMRKQLETMGASFDWSKEIITCDPSYYKWTQWLFTKFLDHGLAERKLAPVKWCPKCKTVLANEQVVDGCCERCSTQVEEKRLTQWFLKITRYAERLLGGLEKLQWREEIKEAQRAWIGKSEGVKLKFKLTESRDIVSPYIEVFTTRPDTIFGATYLVLAPEHPLVQEIINSTHQILNVNRDIVKKYVLETAQKTERERSENKDKTGVRLDGILAINPATLEEIPVYVADYIIGSYGTGAIMAVPHHDDRDREFAIVHNLPIRDAKLASSDEITLMGGESVIQYRLRDWLVSRQRYWGCPIPVVYDPSGNPHAIPAEHLPWLLPTDADFTPTGEPPLASSAELKERVVKIFGEGWTPEYDTLDTFVDSSWYFYRYLASQDSNNFTLPSLTEKWMPINRYSGGSEHTTMHLLYARFFNMVLYDLALVPTQEPFSERFNRGLIMGPDGQKMSKSKGNVINPDEFVQKYGADAVRVYLAFIGPYNEPRSYPWSLDGVASMRKFLERIHRLCDNAIDSVLDKSETISITQFLAQTAQKIYDDCKRFKFNTAVAALMMALNEMEARSSISKSDISQFLILLSPFAPHLAEHLWEKVGNAGSVHSQSWPTIAVAKSETVKVIVQVNGKRRGAIVISSEASEEDAYTAAMELSAVKSALNRTRPDRIVYVPARILNIVVNY